MQNQPDDSKNEQILLSIGEASEHLGVSIDTLRRWDKKGKIESYRSPGNHRYFKKQDLDSLFGKKFERAKETKPRKIREGQVEEKEKKPRFKAEETTSFTNLITYPEAVKILDREPRTVNIPPIQSIKIIKERRFSLTEIQNKHKQTITQEYKVAQQSQSILTPPGLSKEQSQEEEQKAIQDTQMQRTELPQKDVKMKKQKLTTQTLVIILTTIILVIAAAVFAFVILSPQNILSPIP